MTRVISVVSSKGGACKPTTAVCLAAEYLRTGARVRIIGADGPQHHATTWLRDGAALGGIEVLTCPPSLPSAVEASVGHFDVVIIDIIGADTASLSLAAANADLVLIPAMNSPLDFNGVTRTVRRLREVEAELRAPGLGRTIPHRVLLSRTEPETTLYRVIKQRPAEEGVPLQRAEIRRRVACPEPTFIVSAPAFMSDARAAAECAALHHEVTAGLTWVLAELG